MKRNLKGQFTRGTGEVFEGFGVWYDSKGYPCILVGKKEVRLHVFVWERVNGEKPKGFDIHHKNGNKKDFKLENLEALSSSDHKRVHAGWVRQNGEWIAKQCNKCKRILPLDQFYPRKGKTPTALCKPCHNQKLTESHNSSPERRTVFVRRHRECVRRSKQRKLTEVTIK
jgi:hypothetical protein